VQGAAVPIRAAAQETTTYEDALAKYRAGEFEAAVRLVAAMPRSASEQGAGRLFQRTSTGKLADENIRAAIMLHSEAHFDGPHGQLAHTPSWHLDRARRLVQRYVEQEERRSDTSAFVRAWFLLLAAQFQGVRHVDRSEEYLSDARSLFPGDADILLASDLGVRRGFARLTDPATLSARAERWRPWRSYAVQHLWSLA
jgi:hypothetical protein